MRPTRRLLALPPLPPRTELKKLFPPVAFAVVNRLRTSKGKPTDAKRLQPVDERLAGAFVESFGIREGAHVVEGFPGMGSVTRALLNLPPQHVRSILSLEPSKSFLVNGLDFPPEARTFDPSQSIWSGSGSLGNPLARGGAATGPGDSEAWRRLVQNPVATSEYENPDTKGKGQAGQDEMVETDHEWFVVQSKHDPRLKIVDNSIYRWDSMEELIKGGYLDHVQPRKWEEDTPDLHLVAQIPGVGLGEQLVAQWISCIPQRSWLFRYGRMKMSLLVTPNLYDRLTAKPGDKTYCKLSAIRSALADITPSHPSYVNYSRGGRLPSPPSADASSAPVSSSPTPSPSDILLSTDPQLYYPNYAPRSSAERESGVRARPGLLGVTLTPRKTSLIAAESKDAWDYVTRKLFVMQNQAIGSCIKNLGPGAANLLPQLIEPSLPAEQRIDARKRVRDFDERDWARIVEVFMGWRFAPETLQLTENYDERVDHKSRNMGQSL